MTTKIILDTDIGSDIDDAVCLAYLLSQPQCELLGITTVTGEVEKRAMMASAMCTVAGRSDIPIYPGADNPLFIKQLQPLAQQATALPKWPHQSEFPQGQSIKFLRETIRKYPGEVTLLTIGPLTNIALLFKIDPECAGLLKQVVSMAGVFGARSDGSNSPEWNAMLDPEATSMVYKARPPRHISIGLDVTTKVTMDVSSVKRRFQAKVLRPVLDFAEVWFRTADGITFHDPLAATVIFDKSICAYERGTVTVELGESSTAGKTVFVPASAADAPAPHEVAFGVNPQQFFDHYFGLVK